MDVYKPFCDITRAENAGQDPTPQTLLISTMI